LPKIKELIGFKSRKEPFRKHRESKVPTQTGTGLCARNTDCKTAVMLMDGILLPMFTAVTIHHKDAEV
jgi:hypothetical protein